MTPAQRDASIQKFSNDPNVTVFLISLKAGGVALNLTAASRVFICDPWWNPAAGELPSIGKNAACYGSMDTVMMHKLK